MLVLVAMFGSVAITGQETNEASNRVERSAPSPASLSKDIYPEFRISERDLAATIDYFNADNPKAAVANFKAKMPAPVTDSRIRDGILRQLPAQVQKLKINNSEIVEKFRKVVAPVLELYVRDKVYDIIIFRHSTPILFSDSGVVIVISTGMIARLDSDDELLGYIAHEIAHELFARYSIYSRYLLKLITEGGSEPALRSKLAEIFGLIELQCDALAAQTLLHLDKNPLAFIEGMERIGRDYPLHNLGFHPPDNVRRRLVEQIISETSASHDSRVSNDLQVLKRLISEQD